MTSKNDKEKAFENLNELLIEVKDMNYSVNDLCKQLRELDSRIEIAFPKTTIHSCYGTQGYINWTYSSENLAGQRWKKLAEFITYLGSAERNEIRDDCPHPPRPDMNVYVSINTLTRFPSDEEDELYLNVKNPIVVAEMLCVDEVMKNTDKKCRVGLIKHFLKVVKDSIHTRSSFEAKYGLNWRDYRRYNC